MSKHRATAPGRSTPCQATRRRVCGLRVTGSASRFAVFAAPCPAHGYLCLRFDGSLTTASARLEARRFATSFLSFILDCMPVYPGALSGAFLSPRGTRPLGARHSEYGTRQPAAVHDVIWCGGCRPNVSGRSCWRLPRKHKRAGRIGCAGPRRNCDGRPPNEGWSGTACRKMNASPSSTPYCTRNSLATDCRFRHQHPVFREGLAGKSLPMRRAGAGRRVPGLHLLGFDGGTDPLLQVGRAGRRCSKESARFSCIFRLTNPETYDSLQ